MSEETRLVDMQLSQAETYLEAADDSLTDGYRLACIKLAEKAIERAHIALRNAYPAEYAAWVAAGRPRS